MRRLIGCLVLLGIGFGFWFWRRGPDRSEVVGELIYLEYHSEDWLVLFGFVFDGKWVPKLDDSHGKTINRVSFAQPVEPGGLFFADGPMKHRFRFIGFDERVVFNERLKIDEGLRFGVFEDRKAGKEGTLYEIPNRLPRAQRHHHRQQDHRATFSFRDGKSFSVDEGECFALPPEFPDPDFRLKAVTPESVVIEWEDAGASRSVRLALREAP